MKKLLKSKKALSPVIASIILIAVTVAVSIAVAAWMGALSFTFMATEQVNFTGCVYVDDGTSVTLTVKNTGTSKVTIDRVMVNNVDSTSDSTLTTTALTLDPNQADDITITATFEAGANYAFSVYTSKNNQFGPYTKTAPS